MSAPSARYFLTYCSWQCLAFYPWLPSSSLHCWSPSLLVLTWPKRASGQQSWKHLFGANILSTDWTNQLFSRKHGWRLKVWSLNSPRVTMFHNFSILCFSWSALNIFNNAYIIFGKCQNRKSGKTDLNSSRCRISRFHWLVTDRVMTGVIWCDPVWTGDFVLIHWQLRW